MRTDRRAARADRLWGEGEGEERGIGLLPGDAARTGWTNRRPYWRDAHRAIAVLRVPASACLGDRHAGHSAIGQDRCAVALPAAALLRPASPRPEIALQGVSHTFSYLWSVQRGATAAARLCAPTALADRPSHGAVAVALLGGGGGRHGRPRVPGERHKPNGYILPKLGAGVELQGAGSVRMATRGRR